LAGLLAAGDEQGGIALAQEALDAGVSPLAFALEVVEPELTTVGDRFARLEIFLPELMAAATVVKALQQQILAPAIEEESGGTAGAAGRVVIGTVHGDIHDIGKNMVALLLQVGGFEVMDLGTDVAPRQFVEAAQRSQAHIIAMSSLITPSMPYMADTVALLEGLGERDSYRVVVGGAPVTKAFANEIGADGYGSDAVQAVAVCQRLLKGERS